MPATSQVVSQEAPRDPSNHVCAGRGSEQFTQHICVAYVCPIAFSYMQLPGLDEPEFRQVIQLPSLLQPGSETYRHDESDKHADTASSAVLYSAMRLLLVHERLCSCGQVTGTSLVPVRAAGIAGWLKPKSQRHDPLPAVEQGA